jgi:hypothetical protein
VFHILYSFSVRRFILKNVSLSVHWAAASNDTNYFVTGVSHLSLKPGGKNMGRIVFAVIAGFVVWTALWLAVGMTAQKIAPGAVPADQFVESTGALVIFIVFSVIISIVSGVVAVRIAPGAAGKAAGILAGVLLIVGIGVEVGGWDTTPVWYHIVFLVLLVPSVLTGARIGRPRLS